MRISTGANEANEGPKNSSFSRRDDERNHLPSVFAIGSKVVVRGEHHGVVALLDHPDQARICKTHWRIAIATDEPERFCQFVLEGIAHHNDSAFKETTQRFFSVPRPF